MTLELTPDDTQSSIKKIASTNGLVATLVQCSVCGHIVYRDKVCPFPRMLKWCPLDGDMVTGDDTGKGTQMDTVVSKVRLKDEASKMTSRHQKKAVLVEA